MTIDVAAPSPAPSNGKAKAGEACDPTGDNNGCDDSGDPKLRCQTAPAKGKDTCIDATTCDTGDGDAAITCGAKALAATMAAVVAFASTM